ncbi:MAG: amidohydrolase [Bacteroidia bacterium]
MKKSKRFKKLSGPKWPQCISGLLFIFFLSACAVKKQKADLIIHNAVVYTVDSSFTNSEAFAVKDGKFIAVGSNDEILSGYEAKEIIDAEGKAVYPGFIDSHCHFYGYGKGLQECDLVGTKSFEEVLEKVKAYAKTCPDEWIIGRGWDQNDWKVKEFPTNMFLDTIFPDRPVVLKRVDGHAVLANHEALKRAGIDGFTTVEGGKVEYSNWPYDDTWSTPGKMILRTDARVATGILIDNAVDLLEKVIPKPSAAAIKSSLLAAQKNCFAVGLTTVDDAGLEKNIVGNIEALQKSGELKMRIYAMLTDNQENKDYYLKKGPYKTERLNVRSFKFYADGALGSRGACLIQPYTDRPDQRGFLLSKPEHFDSAAVLMNKYNFQMNTHCIGDSANSLIMRIYLKNTYAHIYATPTHCGLYRWRIEHAQVIDPTVFKHLDPQSYVIIPSVQPTHATSDMYWAKDRLGPERVKYAYAYNDLLKAAGMLALGTDFPVENINPMYTFYAAVARKDLKGFPKDGFQMENALSREATLKGMTIWGAYANFEEREKGSIEAGKFADFVILDKDIMKCEIDSVPKVKVVYTYVNGEKVFGK